MCSWSGVRSSEKRKWKMANEREKARPQVFPPTSKASGMDETVTARKKADEQTRKSHIGPGGHAWETRRSGGKGAAREGRDAIGWCVEVGGWDKVFQGQVMMKKQRKEETKR